MNEALILLILVWAAVLLPAAVRAARTPSAHSTVGGFERTMEVLSREHRPPGREVLVPADADRVVRRAAATAPVPPSAPAPPPPVQQEDPVIARRRARFLRLLAATGASLLAAVVFGGWFWLPAVVTVAATATSVVVLRRLKLQRDRAREVVREIDLRDDPVEVREAVAVGGDGWSPGGTIRLRHWDA